MAEEGREVLGEEGGGGVSRKVRVFVQLAGAPGRPMDMFDADEVRIEPMPVRGWWVVVDGREMVCSEVLVNLGPEKEKKGGPGMKREFLVQAHRRAPEFMRKRWREVRAETYEDAVVAVLRKCGKAAIRRLARATGGEAWFAVAAKEHATYSNVRPNGTPVTVNGYAVKIGVEA